MNKFKLLIALLETRLEHAEEYAKMGVIPGVQDTYELEQIIGRIKELQKCIGLANIIESKTKAIKI